jgi:TonB family protein
LLQSFLTELDEKQVPRDTFELHERLKQILAREAQTRRRVLLVIDEAQNLGDVVMETVRLLSNFESANSKLLHIILAGQPELAAKLAGSGLSQLLQRIPILTNLEQLTREEVASYIDHRLRIAGSPAKPLFRPETVHRIATLSRGVPREINRLCFNCLSLAYASSKPFVDLQVVEEVTADLDLSAHVQKRDEFFRNDSPSADAQRVELARRSTESAAVAERRETKSTMTVAATAAEDVTPAARQDSRSAGGQNGRVSRSPQRHKAPTRPSVTLSYKWPGRTRPFAFALLYLALIAAGGMSVTRWLDPGSATGPVQSAGEQEAAVFAHRGSTDVPVRDSSSANSRTIVRRNGPPVAFGQQRDRNVASGSSPGKGSAFVAKAPTSQLQLHNPRLAAQGTPAGKGTRRLEPSISTTAEKELLSFVPVQYPERALDRHIEGTVILKAMLATDGTVKSVRPVSGDPLLLNAAATAVRGWVYRPHRINGTPVTIDKQIVISFSLSKDSNP